MKFGTYLGCSLHSLKYPDLSPYLHEKFLDPPLLRVKLQYIEIFLISSITIFGFFNIIH